MWWFLIGFISLIVAVGILWLGILVEVLPIQKGPFTLGDATLVFLGIAGSIVLGPVTTVFLIIAIFMVLLDSDKVLWEPKKTNSEGID